MTRVAVVSAWRNDSVRTFDTAGWHYDATFRLQESDVAKAVKP